MNPDPASTNAASSSTGAGSNGAAPQSNRNRTKKEAVTAQSGRSGGPSRPRYTYDAGEVLGNGSFGVVSEARCLETGETVAIKKVLQDPRYKNRELDIMKMLRHPNVVELKDYFYTEKPGGEKGESEKFLNVVMEFIPDTVYRVMKTFVRNSQHMPMILTKLYTYQMCRALGYLHTIGVCHRDIKPQNLLVDTKTHTLKICDFGSAKKLIPGEQSVAYICSRYYRAPELMLGATEYTTAIDIWSIGCVMGELMLGRPLFAGETSVDQLVKIIQTMGTPSRDQMQAMNPNYTEFRFPDVKPRPWNRIFHPGVTPDALDLLSKLLRYEPQERVKPYEALAHHFFDELRDVNTRLPGGGTLPPLFDVTEAEMQQIPPPMREKVIPSWYSQMHPTGPTGTSG